MQKRFLIGSYAILSTVTLHHCSEATEPRNRLIVEVAPVDIGGREFDEMPATIEVDWKLVLADAKLVGRVDFDSIRVTQLYADGKPVIYGKGSDDLPTVERPFRWYDADIPNPFPVFQETLSRVGGKITTKPAKGVGYLYNTSGRGEKGLLGFIHTQTKLSVSRYAIDFELLDTSSRRANNGPRGWIGDGQLRCGPVSKTTTGGGHSRIALDDWNDDGLVDIVQGEETGVLFVFQNTGSKTEPKFTGRSFLLDAKGQPIDVGTHAAPLVIDFNGDGNKDLLVGTYQNRIAYFKNTGTNSERRLIYRGLVMVDDKPLEIPIRPLAGGASEKIFNHDYYPVLEAADWNGDGRMDLLAGGYVTGRIFLLEGVGANPDGTMKLRVGDPLSADGKVINVGDWCAAPTAADLNSDSRLDIVTGRQSFSKESAKDDSFLRYYQSSGSSKPSTLTQIPLPVEAKFSNTGLATPRAADLNDDGLLDLVVSARENIYLFYNRGTKTEPKFEAHANALPIAWGPDDLPGTLFVDYNRDGLADMFGRYRVFINIGQISPFHFMHERNVLPAGVNIAHPSGIGDDWFWPALYDLDKDGDWDVLFGDWHGTIWFHRNNGNDAAPDFDIAGYRLQTTAGADVKVGPIGGDTAKDFNVLQGARTEFAVDDMDADGLPDLLIGDTFGIVRYFKNVGPLADPKYELAMEVGSVKIRCSVDALDWDGDGKRDIIAGAANGIVRIFRNTGEKGMARFDEGIDPKLPPLQQPRVRIVDLNNDGDEDLLIPSLQGSAWIERSFLKHGYAEAKIVSTETQRP